MEYESFRRNNQSRPPFVYANAAVNIGMDDRAIELLQRGNREINPYTNAVYEELIRLYIKKKKRLQKPLKTLDTAKKYISNYSPVLYLFKERLEHSHIWNEECKKVELILKKLLTGK